MTNNEFPRRRSLESLKKEAKRWLDALGDIGATTARTARERLANSLGTIPQLPTLRDVQHALARENGFAGWTALKEALQPDAKTSTSAIAQYEEKAEALLEAYRTGTPEALERHCALTWHRRAWHAMRTYIQLDLGKRPAHESDDVEITADDARFLIAIEHGFANWPVLIAFAKQTPSGLPTAATPVRVTARRVSFDGDIEPATIIASRDWGTVLRALADNPGASLDAHGQMTDEMLAQVSRIPHIESLNLNNSAAITADGVRHLARLPQLRGLDLSQTAANDSWLNILRDLPNLKSLSLVMTAVTDAGIAYVAHCSELHELNLMWTNTGDGAIRALAGMQELTHFTSGNLLSDAGLALLHELPQFKTWREAAVRIGLLSNESKPNQLSLRGFFTDNGLNNLRGLDGLFGLNIDDSQQPLSARGIAALSSLPHLGFLSLDAKDDWMEHIARIPTLRFLSAQDTIASDSGWIALGKSQSLEYIWGRRCHNLRMRGFQALATLPKLRGLSVSCLNVSDEGIALLPHFPALRELMPMDVPDSGYRHIGRCENLEALLLMYCRATTDAATEHIGGLAKLQRYFNSYTTVTDRTPQLLSAMDSLQEITFDACHGLTNAGVAQLARLPKLKRLCISGNHLTADVVKEFPSRITVHYSH